MRVTGDDIIRSGERELIDGITADLDWETVERIFREAHGLPLGEDVSYKSGDLVVHEDRIAYLLEFEVKVPLSMLLDRQGNCIGLRAGASEEEGEEEPGPTTAPETDPAGVASPGSAHPAPEGHGDPEGDPIDQRMAEAREVLVGMGEAPGR
jgi:hypothetical protein